MAAILSTSDSMLPTESGELWKVRWKNGKVERDIKFFRLSRKDLEIFETKKQCKGKKILQIQPKGQKIPLSAIVAVELSDAEYHGYCNIFQVIYADSHRSRNEYKTLYIKTRNIETRNRWIDAIRKSVSSLTTRKVTPLRRYHPGFLLKPDGNNNIRYTCCMDRMLLYERTSSSDGCKPTTDMGDWPLGGSSNMDKNGQFRTSSAVDSVSSNALHRSSRQCPPMPKSKSSAEENSEDEEDGYARILNFPTSPSAGDHIYSLTNQDHDHEVSSNGTDSYCKVIQEIEAKLRSIQVHLGANSQSRVHFTTVDCAKFSHNSGTAEFDQHTDDRHQGSRTVPAHFGRYMGHNSGNQTTELLVLVKVICHSEHNAPRVDEPKLTYLLTSPTLATSATFSPDSSHSASDSTNKEHLEEKPEETARKTTTKLPENYVFIAPHPKQGTSTKHDIVSAKHFVKQDEEVFSETGDFKIRCQQSGQPSEDIGQLFGKHNLSISQSADDTTVPTDLVSVNVTFSVSEFDLNLEENIVSDIGRDKAQSHEKDCRRIVRLAALQNRISGERVHGTTPHCGTSTTLLPPGEEFDLRETVNQ